MSDAVRARGVRRRGARSILLSNVDGTVAECDLDPSLPRTRSDARAALVACSSLSPASTGLAGGRRRPGVAGRAEPAAPAAGDRR